MNMKSFIFEFHVKLVVFCVFLGVGDRVQCVFCRGILRDWDVGEKPHIEHKNKFPRCPFILGVNVGNVRMTPIQPAHRINVGGGSNNQSLGHMEALGINTDRPKHANFAVESTRLTSFNNWPQYKHQTPQQLAAAGFFYAGNWEFTMDIFIKIINKILGSISNTCIPINLAFGYSNWIHLFQLNL